MVAGPEDRGPFYKSPTGVSVLASINAAIVALGGTPIEPDPGRFYKTPHGQKILDALAELETSAGLEPTVVEQGRFFKSPRGRDILDRINAVITDLGGEPISDPDAGLYTSPPGRIVAEALAALHESAETGGGDPLAEIVFAQYAGAVPPLIGTGAVVGPIFEHAQITITRPASILALTAGKVVGRAVGNALIEIQNAARIAGGMSTFINQRWNLNSTALNGLGLLLFNDQPATIYNDGDTINLPDVDAAKVIGFSVFGLGGQRLWQSIGILDSASGVTVGSNQTDVVLVGTSLWAYIVASGAWNAPAGMTLKMKPWLRWRS